MTCSNHKNTATNPNDKFCDCCGTGESSGVMTAACQVANAKRLMLHWSHFAGLTKLNVLESVVGRIQREESLPCPHTFLNGGGLADRCVRMHTYT